MNKFILLSLFFYLFSGCINKMNLPDDIKSDIEFSVGDTTYLMINPVWGPEFGLRHPTEISISKDGLIFIADSIASSIHVINQSGEVQEEFNILKSIQINGNPLNPIDVGIDSRMNVYIIDGSNKIYCWNQLWNYKGIESFVSGGTFITETEEDSFIYSYSELWEKAVNNPEWNLTELVWSDNDLIIDSLLAINSIFDSQSSDSTGDIWYTSSLSLFSGITTSADNSKTIYVTDYYHNRILALVLKRSLLIKLNSGEIIWTHKLVYDHTVSEYGTGAGTVNKPLAIDADNIGNIYYAQKGNFFSIHKIQPILSGTYPIYPSVFQPDWNDIMELYRFESPMDVTVDNNQYVYVANSAAREIQVFNHSGQFFLKAGVETLTVDSLTWEDWNVQGTDTLLVDTLFFDSNEFYRVEIIKSLKYPIALAVDNRGVIYVCDPQLNSVVRFRLSNQLDENLNPID